MFRFLEKGNLLTAALSGTVIAWASILQSINRISFCGAAAQRGPWPPHSWCCYITHNEAPQSVGLLWTSDHTDVETSTWRHTTVTTDKHPCPGWIRTHDLSRRAAADLHLWPRGHWDRHICINRIDLAKCAPNCWPYFKQIIQPVFCRVCLLCAHRALTGCCVHI